MENEKIVELPVDQRTVTRRYTDRSIDFIKANKDKPFFLYLPHSMPHIPLYVPDEIRDPNPLNAYTNVIEHIDAEVGRIADLLRELKLDQNTYLIFTTDNGPWLQFKHHGGSAGPLREGKGTTFEGGQRVPCVMWAPGRIPADTTCDQLCGTIDLLPTIAALTKTPLPKDKKIDGLDISDLLAGGNKSPRNEFIYYTSRGDLEGLRQGKYKLLIKKNRRQKNQPADRANIMLFDLEADLGEKNNLTEEHPEIVAKLGIRMQELDAEITKNQRQPWLKK
jgi:arylsulfatase A-like enzyme